MSVAVAEINRLKSCLKDDESGESSKTNVDEPTGAEITSKDVGADERSVA